MTKQSARRTRERIKDPARRPSTKAASMPHFDFTGFRVGIGMTLILAGGVLLPTGLLKFLAASVGIVLACGPVSLTKAQTRFILGACFTLSYIVLPYWRIPETPAHEQLALAAFCAIGLAWCWISSDAVEWGRAGSPARDAALAVVAAALFIIGLPGLHAEFPLGGDEVHHIVVTNVVRMSANDSWTIIAALIMIPALWAAWWLSRKDNPAARWGALAVGIAALCPLALFPQLPGLTHSQLMERDKFISTLLLRYPCFTYWPRALFLSHSNRNALDLSEYRVFPGASYVALGAAFFLLLDSVIAPWLRALFALALMTIPSLVAFAARNYLEMPLLVLELIVCARLDLVLRMSFAQMRRDVAWFCLLLAGFIKEVTFPLAATFAILHSFVQLPTVLGTAFKKRDFRTAGGQIAGIAGAGICANIPLAIYLFMRNLNNPRVYNPKFSVLWTTPNLYHTVFRAAWDQYSIAGPISLVAALWLLWRRQYLFVAANLCVSVAFFVFFTADSPAYVGLARWGMLIYIPLAALVVRALKDVATTEKSRAVQVVAGVAAAATIAIHLAHSPVALDGTLPDHWGMYNINDAEVFYPFDKLFPWLTANLPNETQIPIVGQPSNRQCLTDQYSYTWRGQLLPFKGPNQKDPIFPTQVQQAADAARRSGLKHLIWSLPTTTFNQSDLAKISGVRYVAQFSNARHTMVVMEIN